MLRTCSLILLLVTLTALSVSAGKIKHETRRIEVDQARHIIVEGEFGAGEFSIEAEDQDELAIINIDYDSRRVDFDIEYDERGRKGRLVMESYNRRKNSIDTEDNIWDIVLSTKYSMELFLEIGACSAEFEFGGIPLRQLELEIGAASAEIYFSDPNPERLKIIDIEVGASSLTMESIGNANFEEFRFEGGVGSFELDFRGEYEVSAEISIEIGMGSADITLPRDVPVRIYTDGSNWFSSIDIHGGDLDEIDDDLYESPDYDRSSVSIELSIDVGMGAIDIYFR